jgi:uncharacterized protein
MSLKLKRDNLLGILRQMQSVAVAFSGGVDSAVVARAAWEALGDHAVAVTAHSASVAQQERDDAASIAQQIGIRHVIIQTDEFSNPAYLANDGNRCYHCKSELYDQIVLRAPQLHVNHIVSGANLDDLGDYRPGLHAAKERAVRHPLQEASFTKADVRALAQEWQLPIWDKPASPCLSSRLVPGLAVTPERTKRIEQAEAWLRDLGLREFRLHEGELARIEVDPDTMKQLCEPATRQLLTETFLKLGFRFVTLDLIGFRSGNMNELIPLETRQRYQS